MTNSRLAEPFLHRLAALVGLYDDEDLVDAFEMLGVASSFQFAAPGRPTAGIP